MTDNDIREWAYLYKSHLLGVLSNGHKSVPREFMNLYNLVPASVLKDCELVIKQMIELNYVMNTELWKVMTDNV